MIPLPRQDLDHVLDCTADLWPDLRRQHLFVTGGTGFFGRWLVETFLWAEQRLALQARMTVLTRDPARFLATAPHLAHASALHLLQGDICTLPRLPDDASVFIHGAATVGVAATHLGNLDTWNTLVRGTQRILDLAYRNSVSSLLFISSGAIYGRQPPEIARLAETFAGAPDLTTARSAYGEGKRAAEMLCTLYAKAFDIPIKIARCFAFVGPHLPLNAQYAVGNFIRDGMAGGPIRVSGDGTAVRTYLYAADLSIWLWTILLRGQSLHPYNVGSTEAMTIREVAERVADMFEPRPTIHIAQRGLPEVARSFYVPEVSRAQIELGLQETIPFHDAVFRTIRWLESQ